MDTTDFERWRKYSQLVITPKLASNFLLVSHQPLPTFRQMSCFEFRIVSWKGCVGLSNSQNVAGAYRSLLKVQEAPPSETAPFGPLPWTMQMESVDFLMKFACLNPLVAECTWFMATLTDSNTSPKSKHFFNFFHISILLQFSQCLKHHHF